MIARRSPLVNRRLRAHPPQQRLILTGKWQLTDLDEEIELTPGPEITFLKLVPVVGG
ncbi:hypothetical protein ITP53_08705 [Nonomuraea sp. K274]|uniref:Uncharacterized protein n=1 Tax=Nonomuraea cypriaca TaxID=1187855 RepID=A0A931A6D0_9ACTN|nr:hypothetical protein [Nonomuraea cypriaca]MBF8185820.1 hypothetical protein [Nonomuraea cypriaca]